MNNKHTRGPWGIQESWHHASGADIIVTARNGEIMVADCDSLDGRSKKECEANARMIASCPRLVKALAGLAQYANGKLGKNPYLIPEFKEALEALGEATGHQGEWMDVDVKTLADSY